MKNKKNSSEKVVTEGVLTRTLDKALGDLSDVLTQRMEVTENNVHQLKERVGKIEAKLDNLNDKMMTGFDKVMMRLDDIDSNFTLLNGQVNDHEERIVTLEHKRN